MVGCFHARKAAAQNDDAGFDGACGGFGPRLIAKEARGHDDLDAQIDQMLEMYSAGGAQMIYFAMSEDDVQRILREPFTMIAADAGVQNPNSDSIPHPRGYGNNVRVLGRYVRELKQITLEDAIRKMTSLPAQTFGLQGRGLIREGLAADLVLFDETSVGDLATFEKPHQYAAGISYVFVNGQAVVADGQPTGAKPGQALRGPGYQALSIAYQDLPQSSAQWLSSAHTNVQREDCD